MGWVPNGGFGWRRTATGGGGSGPVNPSTNGFRLSLASGVPKTDTDTTGDTVYDVEFRGNLKSLRYSDDWKTYQPGERSMVLPNDKHRIFDWFDYAIDADTAGSEWKAWDESGQVTGTITGATSDYPCVLTAANSLSVGDFVVVDDIVGDLGTDSLQGLNGAICKVSACDSTTITLEGMDTTSLTYTSGGNFYKLPVDREEDIERLDGQHVLSSDHTRIYRGSVRTGSTAGESASTSATEWVFNYANQLDDFLVAKSEDDWTWTSPVSGVNPPRRATQGSTKLGLTRCEVLVGLVEKSSMECSRQDRAVMGNDNTVIAGITLNSCLATPVAAWTQSYTGSTLWHTCRSKFTPALGLNFLQSTEGLAYSSGSSISFIGTDSANTYSVDNLSGVMQVGIKR